MPATSLFVAVLFLFLTTRAVADDPPKLEYKVEKEFDKKIKATLEVESKEVLKTGDFALAPNKKFVTYSFDMKKESAFSITIENMTKTHELQVFVINVKDGKVIDHHEFKIKAEDSLKIESKGRKLPPGETMNFSIFPVKRKID